MNRGLQGIPDNDLVAAVVGQRSESASAELFRRYRKRVYLWCFNIGHDRDEAVDLTQEVFIRVFNGLAGFDGRARFSTWVYQVTRNHCLSVVATRKRTWRQRLASLEGVDAADHTFADQLHQAELAGEIDQLLRAAAKLMKNDELEAFVLHYRDSLSVKEISRILGCTNATGARTLIQNARRKFKRLTESKERESERDA
jgi:RNA polymerase sigma-70 factor (ECF subfamily)